MDESVIRAVVTDGTALTRGSKRPSRLPTGDRQNWTGQHRCGRFPPIGVGSDIVIRSSVRLTKVVKGGGEDQTLVHCKCRNLRSAAREMGGDRRESVAFWIESRADGSGDEICSDVSVIGYESSASVGERGRGRERWSLNGQAARWSVDYRPVERGWVVGGKVKQGKWKTFGSQRLINQSVAAGVRVVGHHARTHSVQQQRTVVQIRVTHTAVCKRHAKEDEDGVAFSDELVSGCCHLSKCSLLVPLDGARQHRLLILVGEEGWWTAWKGDECCCCCCQGRSKRGAA